MEQEMTTIEFKTIIEMVRMIVADSKTIEEALEKIDSLSIMEEK